MCAGAGGGERLCPAAVGSRGEEAQPAGGGLAPTELGVSPELLLSAGWAVLCLLSILRAWPRGLSPGVRQLLA